MTLNAYAPCSTFTKHLLLFNLPKLPLKGGFSSYGFNPQPMSTRREGDLPRAGGLGLAVVSAACSHLYKAYTLDDHAAIQNDSGTPRLSCGETSGVASLRVTSSDRVTYVPQQFYSARVSINTSIC